MYKLHLILKYLRKRRIAWVSLVAVTLCTAMVLVVISVMGGWLRMFEQSFHGLSGDVIVRSRSLTGFSHYDQVIARLQQLPSVEAATPIIRTYGLININNLELQGVQVLAFPGDRIGKVNNFPESLWLWKNPQDMPSISLGDEAETPQEKVAKQGIFDKPLTAETYRAITGWKNKEESRGSDPAGWSGMILGADLLGIGRDKQGDITGRDDRLYTFPVKLTVLGLSQDFSVDLGNKSERTYWIADDSRTQVWQYDSNFVYVPFEQLQADLGMTEKTVTDKRTKKKVTIPARTSEIHVKVRPEWQDGAKLVEAREQIEAAVDEVLDAQTRRGGVALWPEIVVQTWRESQAKWLGAIEKEKLLTVFLFGIISVVAIFLIFCIFYMIVAEKTKDIGIIKSVGASAGGVMGIFLGYGAAIGIVGAGLGLLFSFLIVKYINEIHTWLGRRLGVQVWDPEVYLFDQIPNTMDPKETTIIVAIAVLASVIGALVPAIRAARMNPVEALRWE